jgi:hypothetical protein
MAWRGPVSKPAVNKPVPNPVNNGMEMSDSKKPIVASSAGPLNVPNRAYNRRRDTDKQKNFSVSLVDIDSAILSYLDNVISPTIVDAGRQIKVPINYASPERWKAIRKDGAMRDKNGKIQTPAIAFRRSTMQRNDGLITLNRYLQYPVQKKFSEKNKYDKFSAMSGFAPVKEVYSVAMPDHVIINYEFIVWTELIEQGNAIVEAVNFSTEDYWGDKRKFKFRTSISDYSFETSTDAGNDRLVRSTFSMMCYAYLLPDKFENYKSVVQKAMTPRKILFTTEIVTENPNVKVSELGSATPVQMKSSAQSAGNAIGFPGITQIANFANFAGSANAANFAATASYVDFSQMNGNFNGLTISGESGATGSIGTNVVVDVTPDSGSVYIDSVPIESGNTAKWLISINDGGDNFKASEMVANWNNTMVKYYNTEVSEIGNVPVTLSVDNTGGNINLLATAFSGTWTIKMIRTMV